MLYHSLSEDIIIESYNDFVNVDILNEGQVRDFIDRQVDRINGLTKLGLKREDLTEPAKIKRALSKIDNLQGQQDSIRTKATIVIIISCLTSAASMIVLTKNGSNTAEMFAILGIAIGNLAFSRVGLKNDYQKLISAFNSQIRRVDKAIQKEQKKSYPNNGYIRDLKSVRDKLIKNRDLVTNKYKIEYKKLSDIYVM